MIQPRRRSPITCMAACDNCTKARTFNEISLSSRAGSRSRKWPLVPKPALFTNNSGFGTSGHFRDLDPNRLDDEIALNVRALVRLSHVGMRAMGERKRGWIMNVSSVASFQAGPSLAVYAATKAFVTNFSESLHEEGKAVGVKVTALCPGLTRTEFQSVSNTSDLQTQFPGFAWCTAEMVAEVGLADAARGKAISVPGGLYKGLVVASALLPRGVKRWVYGVAMKRR